MNSERLTARLSLHDTVLKVISVDYRDNSAVFSISLIRHTHEAEKIGRIELRDIKAIKLGREQPWGPSESINEAHIESAGDLQRLVIELQSGDEIDALAKSIVLQDIRIAEGRPI